VLQLGKVHEQVRESSHCGEKANAGDAHLEQDVSEVGAADPQPGLLGKGAAAGTLALEAHDDGNGPPEHRLPNPPISLPIRGVLKTL
jgi:hypothetical protein